MTYSYIQHNYPHFEISELQSSQQHIQLTYKCISEISIDKATTTKNC